MKYVPFRQEMFRTYCSASCIWNCILKNICHLFHKRFQSWKHKRKNTKPSKNGVLSHVNYTYLRFLLTVDTFNFTALESMELCDIFYV
jgi:hypothetical protein